MSVETHTETLVKQMNFKVFIALSASYITVLIFKKYIHKHKKITNSSGFCLEWEGLTFKNYPPFISIGSVGK